MNKIRVLLSVLTICFLIGTFMSCSVTMPLENSSEPISVGIVSRPEHSTVQSDESSAMPEPISSEVSEASAPLSEAPEPSVPDYSSEDSSEDASSDPEISEPSDEPSSEVSEPYDGSTAGKLFAPYLAILETGVYSSKTVENRIAGGESVPYAVTTYHNGEAVYAVIEESYGSVSLYILKDNRLIALNELEKTAFVTDYSPAMFSEKQLWTGTITYVSSGTQTMYDTVFDYETYTDSTGHAFTLYFRGGELQRYKSYSEVAKNDIVIQYSVSADMSAAIFDIPSGYTVTYDD